MSDLRAPDESCTHGLPEGAGMLGRRPYCPPSAVPTYMRTSHSFCSLPDLPDLRVVTLFLIEGHGPKFLWGILRWAKVNVQQVLGHSKSREAA